MKDLIKNQDTKVNECNNEVQRLSNENVRLRSKVNSFTTQYSHRNNLIYGIPEEINKNIHNFMRRLATAIQFPDWSINIVDSVHRMGKESDNDPRLVVIKFVGKLERDELRRGRLGNTSRLLDMGFRNEIYINESLHLQEIFSSSPISRLL